MDADSSDASGTPESVVTDELISKALDKLDEIETPDQIKTKGREFLNDNLGALVGVGISGLVDGLNRWAGGDREGALQLDGLTDAQKVELMKANADALQEIADANVRRAALLKRATQTIPRAAARVLTVALAGGASMKRAAVTRSRRSALVPRP